MLGYTQKIAGRRRRLGDNKAWTARSRSEIRGDCACSLCRLALFGRTARVGAMIALGAGELF